MKILAYIFAIVVVLSPIVGAYFDPLGVPKVGILPAKR